MTARTCLDCGTPLRPKGTSLAEHPGTNMIKARGRCAPCYLVAWRAGDFTPGKYDYRTTAAVAEPQPTPVVVAQYHGTDWRDRAACLDTPLAAYFPERGEAPKDVLDTCATCPVREACLAYAMRTERGLAKDYRAGIYGGLTSWQRARLDRSAS